MIPHSQIGLFFGSGFFLLIHDTTLSSQPKVHHIPLTALRFEDESH